MWTIFKDVFEFITILLWCFGFFTVKHVGSQLHWPGIKPAPPALEGNILTTGPPGKSWSLFLIFLGQLSLTNTKIRFKQNWTRIKSAPWVRCPAGLISGQSASFPGVQTRNPSEKEVSSPRAISPHGDAGFSAVNRKKEGKEWAPGSRARGGKKQAELWTLEPVLVRVPPEADCEAGLRRDWRKYR